MRPPRSLRAHVCGGLLLCLSLLTACGDETVDPVASSASPSPSAEATTQEAPPSPAAKPVSPRPGTEIVARSSEFGTILFDDDGQAIYLFDVETSTKPRCYGACAEAWPPVYAQGAPQAGSKVKDSLLGTTKRRDGRPQVTYGGHPLYYYAHEGKGEVECHDVFLNGGNWFAVAPSGDRAP